MKFCTYLKIINCYIGEEKSQYDFMFALFSKVVCEPFSEVDTQREEQDKYYLFSKLCTESTARKVYSGERILPKALARFVKGHYDPTAFIMLLEDMSDTVKNNLCRDLVEEGITCNEDNVADVVAETLFKFVSAALDESDTIETSIIAKVQNCVYDKKATIDEVLLVEEVRNVCPMCGCFLLRRKGNNVEKKYSIVQIFPDNLSRALFMELNEIHSVKGDYLSENNLIALCNDCTLDYQAELTVDKFQSLLCKKRTLSQQFNLQQSMDSIDLEEGIRVVIDGLIKYSTNGKSQIFDFNLLRIEQKVDSSYGILINAIRDDVIHYYRYIEELFSMADENQTNTFDCIATEIKLAYEKMECNGLPQNKIYEEMINWIMRKTGIEEGYRQAVHIVVSFFVQNCEVFHEIS